MESDSEKGNESKCNFECNHENWNFLIQVIINILETGVKTSETL